MKCFLCALFVVLFLLQSCGAGEIRANKTELQWGCDCGSHSAGPEIVRAVWSNCCPGMLSVRPASLEQLPQAQL